MAPALKYESCRGIARLQVTWSLNFHDQFISAPSHLRAAAPFVRESYFLLSTPLKWRCYRVPVIVWRYGLVWYRPLSCLLLSCLVIINCGTAVFPIFPFFYCIVLVLWRDCLKNYVYVNKTEQLAALAFTCHKHVLTCFTLFSSYFEMTVNHTPTLYSPYPLFSPCCHLLKLSFATSILLSVFHTWVCYLHVLTCTLSIVVCLLFARHCFSSSIVVYLIFTT